MGEFDDHFANFGDWIPPSPSPTSKALFSSLVANDFEGWPPHVEETSESKSRNMVVETQEHVTWCNSDGKDGAGTGATTDQIVKSSAPSEQATSSRGGLMERRAARAGFNAPRLNTDGLRPPAMLQNQVVKSPYLSIAAGISPSVLLYSPDFLRNSLVSNNPLQVHPSPTSGVLPCASGNESNSVMLTTGAADKMKETAFEDNNSSSLPFNPIMETGGVNPSSQIDVSVHPSNSLQPHIMEATENEQTCHETTDVPLLSAEEDVRGSDIVPEVRTSNVVGGSTEHSPSLDEKQDEDSDGDASVEDGYNWRKYGQNQVKGSEYPRSYYKCAHPNCFVKKEIARYHKGHVTEVIYNGAHNHPKPLPNWISALGSSNSLSYMQLDKVDPTGTGVNNQLALETIQQGPTAGGLEGKNDSLEATSLADLHSEYCRASTTFRSSGAQLGSADANDISSTFSNNEVDHGTRGNVSLDCDDEGDESESKIRKIEHRSTDTRGTSRSIRERSIREPRIVVQTTSEVDVLDDGYRWRKYGQKVVKGNPNPRSYYKCTNPGCNVRKHVERAPFDPTSVITTYDGKHNHDIPAERSSNQANSDVSNSRSKPRTTNAQGHAGRTEPTQLQNSRKRYGRAPSFDPTSEFNSSGTNQQQCLIGHAMTGFNSDQHQFSAPAHNSGTNQQQGLTGHAMTGFNSDQHQFSAPAHTSGTNQQQGLTSHAMTRFNSDQHQFSAPAHTSGTNQQQGLTGHAMTRFNSDQHQFSAPAHTSGTNQQQGLTGHAMTRFNSDQHQFSAPAHTSGTNQQQGLTSHAMTRFNSDQHQFSAPAHTSETNQQQGLTGHAMTGFNSDQHQFSAPAHTSGTNQQEGLTGHAMTRFNSDQHQFSAPAHSSGTNQQQGLTGHAMTGFNSDQPQFSAPAHPFPGHLQPVSYARFVPPEGEPIPDPSLNYSNASSTYQQFRNGTPPGPQM